MTGTDERPDAFVRTDDGVSVAYQCRGCGAGRPLVLLAGQANNHHWWNAVREDFHGTARAITLDYRGTGAGDASVRRVLARPFRGAPGGGRRPGP